MLSVKMKNKKETLIVFILDKSGSMSSCKEATISGFNEYINDLKKDKKNKYSMSLTLFDTNIDNKYTNKSLNEIELLDSKSYEPNGCTALYDAIYSTLNKTEKTLEKNQKVLCIIMTDGEENSSKEVTDKEVFKKIDELKKSNKWSFVFLGANQDSWIMGQKFGMSKNCVSNFNSTEKGSTAAFNVMSSATITFACTDKEVTDAFFSKEDKDNLENTK
jgi:uncharacterized protein with von Willebrand factor type A (vWA) domain